MSALRKAKTFVRRTFPRAVRRYQAMRDWLHRQYSGEGDVGVFVTVFDENHWGDQESASGAGSSLAATEVVRAELPSLLRGLGITSLLDAPCGDFNWMQHVDLQGIRYTGADVVPHLVERNAQRFASPGRQFIVRDITTEALPDADAILSRDCLVHLSYAKALAALRNFKNSGARFLLSTTYTDRSANWDIVTGSWRPLNLQLPPFSFPPPIAAINERCTEGDGGFDDKTLAVWRLADLPL
jgi:SAM-dependent methyltransferase